MKNRIHLISCALALILLACGQSRPAQIERLATSTVAALPASQESPATLALAEAAESPPTVAPEAVATEPPTPIPELPTETPPPPLEPIDLSGSGDSVVDAGKPEGPMIARIKGNAENQYFGVTSLDANNEPLDSLVNTTEAYEGVRPVDFIDGQLVTRFEVKAPGNWEIHLLPLSEADKLNVPGEIKGAGDNVIVLTGGTPDLANIAGNASGVYFGVTGYGGSFPNGLVNEVEPYEGQVLLEPDTAVLVVQATGDWTIAVTGK